MTIHLWAQARTRTVCCEAKPADIPDGDRLTALPAVRTCPVRRDAMHLAAQIPVGNDLGRLFTFGSLDAATHCRWHPFQYLVRFKGNHRLCLLCDTEQAAINSRDNYNRSLEQP